MKKRWRITVAGVLAGALVAILAFKAATPPVARDGRSAGDWALQLYGYGESHERAAVALTALGEKAVPDLVRLLGKSDLPFRSQMRGALPSLPATLRPLLMRIYGGPPATELKIAAARALGFLGAQARSAGPALEYRMRDADPGVASEAGLALARVSPDWLRQFQSALNDRSPNARRAAAYALGGLGLEAAPAVPDLLRKLTDPDQSVRDSARGSLSRIGAAAIPAMLECVVNEPGPARDRVADLLLSIYSGPPPRVPRLAELRLDNPELQHARAKTLRRIRPGSADPVVSRVIVAILEDPSAAMRLVALESVGSEPHPGIVLALIRRLKDEDATVRAEAARALGALGTAARPALSRLRGMAATEQETVRVAATEAMRRITDGRHPE